MSLDSSLDSFVVPDIALSNSVHDREHGNPYDMAPIRSAWKESAMMRRGKLTDRKIAQYERKGFYSPEYRLARKELMERKSKKQLARSGNFDLVDGRLIFNPH